MGVAAQLPFSPSQSPATIAGMDQPQTIRRSLFMPWRWPRWLLGLLLFIAYFLSPVPVEHALIVSGAMNSSPLMHQGVEMFYLPASFCAMNCQPLLAFYNWQTSLLRPEPGDSETTRRGPPSTSPTPHN